jgi:hypothetical protein
VTDQLVLLLVGFVLTTVVGGFLGYLFQSRAWNRQEKVRRKQAESEAAKAFFEDLSRLFDRRLHRMRQLDAWLSRPRAREEMEQSLARYREALDEWNDNLNRILALAQRYFGQKLRDNLDYVLMALFVEVGKRLEERVREYRNAEESSSASLTSELDSLANKVYFLNVDLIKTIQSGRVGVFNPDVGTDGEVR